MPLAAGSTRRRHSRPAKDRLRTPRGLRRRLRAIATFPAATLLLCLAAVAAGQQLQPGSEWIAWGAAAAALVAMTGVSLRLAARTAELVCRQRVEDAEAAKEAVEAAAVRVSSLLADAMADVQRAVEEARQGKNVVPPAVGPAGPSDGGPLSVLEWEVRRFVSGVGVSVATASARSTNAALLTIGRRMLPLIVQMLRDFDSLYRDTEDPAVLTPLFRLDHTATRLRRLAESFALVGGAVPRRSTRATPLLEVIDHAISEVERYERVKIASPAAGLIRGDAAPGLVHILAELIDNATAYSPPATPVEIRVEPSPWGVAIEVDDRGQLLPAETRRTLNLLLADPAPHAAETLSDGRIGLWVVAEQARRLDIKVQLRSSVLLSNQAVVFLPKALFAPGGDPAGAARGEETAQALPMPPAGVVGRPVPTPSAASQPPDSGPGDGATVPQQGQAGPLPVRDPGRSYMAAELARQKTPPAASDGPASAPAPRAGLMAQVAEGQRRAQQTGERDRSPAATAAVPTRADLT
jgi:signal transduction histidine kinase